MAIQDQAPLGSGFPAKSEPSDILDGHDLAAKTAIVTGGYSGIGLETTRALAGAGAKVIVPVRTPAKAEENLAGVAGDVSTQQMDLADLASVRAFCESVNAELGSIDLLINNAGVMASPEQRVGPNWEYQFGINHMGHFALTQGITPSLRKAEAPRVVALSSVAHHRNGIMWDDINFENTDYNKWVAYAQAKTANALFAVELNKRLHDYGGRAFSVHPGGIFTPLQRDLPVEEQIMLGWLDEDGNPSALAQAAFKSTTQGCTTTLWAATSPMLDDKGGLYCEDCDVAQAKGDDSPPGLHVSAHAVDDDDAARLWQTSESLLASA